MRMSVNVVAPGYILTSTLQQRVDDDMIDYARLAERAPVGRWGLPEEVARVIGFLSLPGSAFITGATVPVDGGYTVEAIPTRRSAPGRLRSSRCGICFECEHAQAIRRRRSSRRARARIE
jgi:hypothetical protein